ncbi:hypothetical protein XENTR_v10018152 [Xenopus tropicalis]|nr:hypothetical protein XENTR_v10018152 [Xenopus tropicalis]
MWSMKRVAPAGAMLDVPIPRAHNPIPTGSSACAYVPCFLLAASIFSWADHCFPHSAFLWPITGNYPAYCSFCCPHTIPPVLYIHIQCYTLHLSKLGLYSIPILVLINTSVPLSDFFLHLPSSHC